MKLICTKCGAEKPDEEFPQDRRNTRRRGRSSWCRACYRVKTDAWKGDNPEKVRAMHRRSYGQNRQAVRDAQVDDRLRHRYGISLAQYDEMAETQGGVCAICGQPPKQKRLHVDHDHETGRVRGLLCAPCNTRLHALENLAWRAAAEAYLALAEIRDQ
jgi:hypothetical protein